MNLQTILKAVVTSTLCIQLIACGGGTDGSVHTETPNKLNESSDSALTATELPANAMPTATERTEAVELVGESVGETIDVTEQAVDGESPRERKMSGKVSDPFDTQSNSYIVAVYYTEPNFAGGYHIHWANNDTLTGTLTANHKIRSYIRRPNCELKFNPPPGKSGAPDVIKSNDFATYNKDFNGLGSVNPTTISRNCSSNRDAYGILFTGKNYTGSALPIFYDGWNRTQLKGDLSKFANAQSFAYNQTNYFKGTNGKSDMADGINFLVGSTTSSVGSSITLSSDLVDLVARPFADIVLEAREVRLRSACDQPFTCYQAPGCAGSRTVGSDLWRSPMWTQEACFPSRGLPELCWLGLCDEFPQWKRNVRAGSYCDVNRLCVVR